MADYSIDLQYRDGTYIGNVPFTNLQGEFDRYDVPDQVRFDLFSPDLVNYIQLDRLRAGLTECVIRRNNMPIFTGPIWDIDISSESKDLKVSAEDISSYLKRRRIATDTKFTKKRITYITWKLIQDTQALAYGDLGITLGHDSSAPTTTLSYAKKSGQIVYDAISKLATGSTGFDWKIDPYRRLMMYYPRIEINSGLTVEYGGTLRRYSVAQRGRSIANNTMVRGGNKTVSNVYSSVESQQKYGLRHYVKSDSGLKSRSKANSESLGQLTRRKEPVLVVNLVIDTEYCNPLDGDLNYGYIFNVLIDDGWVQYDSSMRCEGYQLTVGKHGEETFVVYATDTKAITDEGVVE